LTVFDFKISITHWILLTTSEHYFTHFIQIGFYAPSCRASWEYLKQVDSYI